MLADLMASSEPLLHGRDDGVRRLRLAIACAVTVLSLACTVSDDDIRREVQARLATNPAMANPAPSVNVQNGVVRLSGRTTASHDVQVEAMRLARSVEGVRVVANEMWIGNAVIAEKVKAALAMDPLVGSVPIEVEARGDTVYLKSDQTNEGQRTRAIQIASAVEGVSRVEDLMK
jgi:osmotically-inducible protein OsmY